MKLDPAGELAVQPARRFALVLGQWGGGGTEGQAQLLVRGLRARGELVDVFIIDGGSPADAPDFGTAPVTVVAGSRQQGLREFVRLVQATLRLRKLLRDQPYQAVHAAMARAYVITPLAARRRGGPRIITWRRNMGVHLAGRSRLKFLERVSARLSSAIVVNSEAVGRYWISHAEANPKIVHVVYNGLEEWRYEKVHEMELAAGGSRLVSVGGFRAVKGHEVLIAAAADLRAQGIEVEVAILGDGPLRSPTLELASSLGVPLIAPGHVKDTRPWLAGGDIYVHPSYSEGSSNAIAEAMAQRCAIVATDVGGAREILGDTGVLIPPGEPILLSRALCVLLKDPVLREKLGVEAQARARSLFSEDVMVTRHLDIYTEGRASCAGFAEL